MVRSRLGLACPFNITPYQNPARFLLPFDHYCRNNRATLLYESRNNISNKKDPGDQYNSLVGSIPEKNKSRNIFLSRNNPVPSLSRNKKAVIDKAGINQYQMPL
jgi:hypothetical protein